MPEFRLGRHRPRSPTGKRASLHTTTAPRLSASYHYCCLVDHRPTRGPESLHPFVESVLGLSILPTSALRKAKPKPPPQQNISRGLFHTFLPLELPALKTYTTSIVPFCSTTAEIYNVARGDEALSKKLDWSNRLVALALPNQRHVSAAFLPKISTDLLAATVNKRRHKHGCALNSQKP